MIFPDHCKFVGVRDCVDDDCEPKIGDKIYFSSKYQITFLKREAAIYKVTSVGDGLIREINTVHKIAGFDDTLIFDTKVDIFNRGSLLNKLSDSAMKRSKLSCTVDSMNTGRLCLNLILRASKRLKSSISLRLILLISLH